MVEPTILEDVEQKTMSALASYDHVHVPDGRCVRDRSGECTAPKYHLGGTTPMINQHMIMQALGNAAATMRPVVIVFPDVELVVTPRRPATEMQGQEPRLVILDEMQQMEDGQEKAAGPCL